MTAKDKLITRFLSQPKDFTFDEVERLFKILGFYLDNKGKTSGSRVVFINEEKDMEYAMHKPHSPNIVKVYAMKQILGFLLENSLVTKNKK